MPILLTPSGYGESQTRRRFLWYDIKQVSLRSCQRSTEVNKFPGLALVANLTESLILAQDERWRRA
jgi:hypothetical protein